MEVTIRQEAGYSLALYGFSLSYKDRAVKPDDWWWFPEHETMYSQKGSWPSKKDKLKRTTATATANAGRGKGHDKFLRQIMVWIDIEAPRYFWSEFDTYKVGTVAQSESTMHTLSKRDMTLGDLDGGEDLPMCLVDGFNSLRDRPSFNSRIDKLKACVPESYLQRRLVTLNYAVLRTIIEQRNNHKLPEWQQFIKDVCEQVDHPELLPKQEEP